MSQSAAVDTVVVPSIRDLGDGFKVRRALPSPQRRTVGPFVFFDQMGPIVLRSGTGMDVRPHPHIGLATLTYLLEGEIMHRDTLGSVQAIHPGEVNWMIAGRGIAHSERTPMPLRQKESALYGIQTWVALPKTEEERAPSFEHHAANTLPQIDAEGKVLRLIAGSLFGCRSPVATLSEMFYADVQLRGEAELALPNDYEERAIYVLQGRVEVDAQAYEEGQLVIARPGATLSMRARIESRVLLLGGESLDGPRHVWWNFVSSSRERIEQAKSDWVQGRFGSIEGDSEFIPLPQAST